MGDTTTPFTSSLNGFEGNQKRISNLFINRTTDDIGLFGTISGANIADIALVDVEITGNDNVGGLVGRKNADTTSDSYE